MERTVRSTHLALAVICLAVLHLTTGTHRLVHSRTNTPTHDAALLLLRASDAPPMAAGWPSPASASSNASRKSLPWPRCLDYYPVAAEPEEAMEPATATTTSTTRAPPRPRFRGVHTHAAPRGISVTAPYEKKTALLSALPLLAVPFLPPPVAALVALTSLATPARARSDDCFKLNHATCAIYPYDKETGTIDRGRPSPDAGLRAVCLHPLCHADSDTRLFSLIWAQKRGRVGDLLHIYCTVRTLEGGDLSILPWRNSWRVHLPVADPGASSSGDICYVELAHLEYREGYYIRCPAAGGHHQTYCTEFPEEEIPAAVWDHRSLTYHATVGPRYATYQDKYVYDHDEL